jgi:hypothetical protein
MRRADLAHLLRAAARIADPEILVIGSQAIHGAFAEHDLPELTMVSREADLAFWNDEREELADKLDGAIGELSMFDETHGYYAQGVSISTAVLPDGWRTRLVLFPDAGAGQAHAQCLEPHDLALSKLVAAREKDRDFVHALLVARLLDPELLHERAGALPVTPIQIATIRRLLRRYLPKP